MKTSILEKEKVLAVLKTCKDPELAYSIVDLGLVYDLKVKPDNSIYVKMTVTTPACPLIDEFLTEVNQKLKAITGVGKVKVDLTFDPPWTPAKLSDEIKAELGLD